MEPKRIVEIINTIFVNSTVYLVDVEIRGDEHHPVIEVFADTEAGITIAECELLNRKIEAELDKTEGFPVKYRLDVSSPGIGCPLEFDWQYRKNRGRDLTVSYQDENNQVITVEGKLEETGDDKITLISKGNPVVILKNSIKTAKVKTKWS